MKKLLLGIISMVGLSIAAHAVPFVGNITFNGEVQMNGTADTATQVTAWNNTKVGGRDQNFVGFVNGGDSVAFFSPWNFSSGVVSNFWQVGGFTFDLIGSSVFTQGGGSVTVLGSGSISGNGYTPTTGSWRFTTQDPGVGSPAEFTFSAASGFVPDGGSTALLLGLALIGVGAVRRRFVSA